MPIFSDFLPHLLNFRCLSYGARRLSRVENVILFGYGTGCQAIMSLVNDRDVEPLVTAVIQVGGINTLVRPDPYDDDKRAWMRKVSTRHLFFDHKLLE